MLARASTECPSPVAQAVACSSCGLRDLCLPLGFTDAEMKRLDGLVARRQSVKRGGFLYRSGRRFDALYAVRTGFFKTRVSSEDGREHIIAFQMAGELLGLDGVSTDEHTCDAIALEDAEVCVIPYTHLLELSNGFEGLQRQVHRIMGSEIVRDHGAMLLLGTMLAEERLAAFLSNLALRFEARGFSPTTFILRMTREEIGTYLGLKLETISRCFSKFQDNGVLEVRHRHIRIVDRPALQALASGAPR